MGISDLRRFRNRGEGGLASWVRWDRGPLGLELGSRIQFGLTPESDRLGVPTYEEAAWRIYADRRLGRE
eukprot:11136166-Alexandrium_andersonii.AAC.1